MFNILKFYIISIIFHFISDNRFDLLFRLLALSHVFCSSCLFEFIVFFGSIARNIADALLFLSLL